MGQNFKDKRVLITGASKGLGKAAAIAFEEEGARLMLAARSADKLKALYDSFSEPGNHLVFNCDLLDSENIKMLTVDATKNWGGVDIILHCIGGSMGVNDTLVDWEAFSKCLKGNIGIASEINRHLVSGMKEQGSGNIIHVGSIVSSEVSSVCSIQYRQGSPVWICSFIGEKNSLRTALLSPAYYLVPFTAKIMPCFVMNIINRKNTEIL